LEFKPQKNYYKKSIFIVDEASMLSIKSDFGKRGLLEDLIQFAFSHKENKLLMIGDNAQLPPIGQKQSNALTTEYYHQFKFPTFEAELHEVMRQVQDSGVLFNATQLRSVLGNEKPVISIKTREFRDIFRMDSSKTEDGLRYAYNKYGVGNTIIVTRSNKAAVNYNLFIRKQIHFYDEELEVGDVIMSVRNNYHYAPPESPSGFVANGDFMEIMKILKFEEMHGFRFAQLELQMYGSTEITERFEAKVLLDTMYSNTTSLSEEQNSSLWRSVSEDYMNIESRKARNEAILNDSFLSAIQIKFAYALTCHKAQGGQWSAVFVDQGFVHEDQDKEDQIKWLYTAVTRATDELFLINFPQDQFAD